jgi:hypothetical protein
MHVVHCCLYYGTIISVYLDIHTLAGKEGVESLI